MAASSFDAALARVLSHEGGYSNHPKDPGGPTMRGIIQSVYDAYRRGRGLSTRSVRNIDDHELKDIYRHQYWDAIRGDALPVGIDLAVFDGAVNSGPAQAAKWLQRSLGLTADGQVGALTLDAAAACTVPAALVEAICDRRLAMLKTLRTWPVFGKGWGRRVADVRAVARSWALAGQAPAASAIPVMDGAPDSAKAPPTSALPPPPAGAGASAAASGLATSAVAEAARQMAPLAASSPELAWVFTLLTLAGLAVALGGIARMWWNARTVARQADVLDLGGGAEAGQ